MKKCPEVVFKPIWIASGTKVIKRAFVWLAMAMPLMGLIHTFSFAQTDSISVDLKSLVLKGRVLLSDLTTPLAEELDHLSLLSEWEPLKFQRIDLAGDLASIAISSYPLSPQEECAMAETHLAEVKQEHSVRQAPSEVIKTLHRLLNALPKTLKSPEFSFQVAVLDSDSANAFTIGAGKIFITQGLLEVLGGDASMNRDALAMLLAHEMGHTVRKHTQRGYQLKKMIRDAGDSLNAGVYTSLFKVGLNKAGELAPFLFSREREYEADIFSLHLCRAAGFDIQKGLQIYRWLALTYSTFFDPFVERRTAWTKADYFYSMHPDPLLRLKWVNHELRGIPSGKAHGLFVYNASHDAFNRVSDVLPAVKNPVIFLHSIDGNKDSFKRFARWLSREGGYPGYSIYSFSFPDDDSLYKSSIFLKQEMARVFGVHSTTRPVFVAFGTGSLIARYYIENMMGEFDKLFLIAPPNKGSNLITLARFMEFMEYSGIDLTPDVSRNMMKTYADGKGQLMFDLKPSSLFLNELGLSPVRPDDYMIIHGQILNRIMAFVLDHTFFMVKKWVIPSLLKEIPHAPLRQAIESQLKTLVIPPEILKGDGLVSNDSVKLPRVRCASLDLRHSSLSESQEVFSLIFPDVYLKPKPEEMSFLGEILDFLMNCFDWLFW